MLEVVCVLLYPAGTAVLNLLVLLICLHRRLPLAFGSHRFVVAWPRWGCGDDYFEGFIASGAELERGAERDFT